jgi:DNA-binding NarL/FixJ family response regulator
MGAFPEQMGLLGSVYRLVGRGYSDWDIAKELGVPETRVRDCIVRMLRYLHIADRLDLVRRASTTVL